MWHIAWKCYYSVKIISNSLYLFVPSNLRSFHYLPSAQCFAHTQPFPFVHPLMLPTSWQLLTTHLKLLSLFISTPWHACKNSAIVGGHIRVCLVLVNPCFIAWWLNPASASDHSSASNSGFFSTCRSHFWPQIIENLSNNRAIVFESSLLFLLTFLWPFCKSLAYWLIGTTLCCSRDCIVNALFLIINRV